MPCTLVEQLGHAQVGAVGQPGSLLAEVPVLQILVVGAVGHARQASGQPACMTISAGCTTGFPARSTTCSVCSRLTVTSYVVPCRSSCAGVKWAVRNGSASQLTVAPAALARNMLLLSWEVNGATWTLHAEVAAVPLLLGCFFAARRGGAAALAAILAAAVAAIPLRSALGLNDAVAAAFPFLVLGALLSRSDGAPWPRSSLVPALAGIALLAANVLLPHGALLRLGLQAVAVSLLVGWVCSADANRVSILRHPLSQRLGRVSFGVYLWNVPIFEAMLRAADPGLRLERPLELGLLVGAAAAALTLPLAFLSERWLERPFTRLGRRLTRLPPSPAT